MSRQPFNPLLPWRQRRSALRRSAWAAPVDVCQYKRERLSHQIGKIELEEDLPGEILSAWVVKSALCYETQRA